MTGCTKARKKQIGVQCTRGRVLVLARSCVVKQVEEKTGVRLPRPVAGDKCAVCVVVVVMVVVVVWETGFSDGMVFACPQQ